MEHQLDLLTETHPSAQASLLNELLSRIVSGDRMSDAEVASVRQTAGQLHGAPSDRSDSATIDEHNRKTIADYAKGVESERRRATRNRIVIAVLLGVGCVAVSLLR